MSYITEKGSLLYTITNSLLFQVETEDVYKYIYEHADDYDFTEYPVNSPYCSTQSKRVVGKFKDVKVNSLLNLLVYDRRCIPSWLLMMITNSGPKVFKKHLLKKTCVMRCTKRVAMSASSLGTNK